MADIPAALLANAHNEPSIKHNQGKLSRLKSKAGKYQPNDMHQADHLCPDTMICGTNPAKRSNGCLSDAKAH